MALTIELTDQIAFVTGASRGIGREIACQLAAAGAIVAACARNEDKLRELVDDIEAAGGRATAVVCDIADSKALQSVMDGVIEAHGRIDILVNNAGITRDGLMLRMKDEDWDAVMNTNLKSVFTSTRKVARTMLKNRSGVILNVTSVVGITGNAGQANYAASKAGIIGFTKSIAKEFGSRGIRCNAIAPGFISTDMTKGLDDQVRQDLQSRIALGRLGVAGDIASVVVFLASNQASYITGQVIVVDGGMA